MMKNNDVEYKESIEETEIEDFKDEALQEVEDNSASFSLIPLN